MVTLLIYLCSLYGSKRGTSCPKRGMRGGFDGGCREKRERGCSEIPLDDQRQPRIKELEQIDFLGTRHGLGAAVHV